MMLVAIILSAFSANLNVLCQHRILRRKNMKLDYSQSCSRRLGAQRLALYYA